MVFEQLCEVVPIDVIGPRDVIQGPVLQPRRRARVAHRRQVGCVGAVKRGADARINGFLGFWEATTTAYASGPRCKPAPSPCTATTTRRLLGFFFLLFFLQDGFAQGVNSRSDANNRRSGATHSLDFRAAGHQQVVEVAQLFLGRLQRLLVHAELVAGRCAQGFEL